MSINFYKFFDNSLLVYYNELLLSIMYRFIDFVVVIGDSELYELLDEWLIVIFICVWYKC